MTLKQSGGPTRGRLILSTRHVLAVLVITAGCASAQGPGDSQAAGPPPGFAWVIFGADTSSVEIADTPHTRGYGLSGRDSLADDSGMLFMWDEDRVRSFWMEDTTLPLDIAFLDPNGVVLSIESLTPLSEVLVNSPQPVRWAVELPRGRLASMGVTAGDTLHILLSAREP